MAVTAKKNPVIREKCGSTAGWNAHQYHDEAQCAGCSQAKTDYTREWRRKTGRTKFKLVALTQEEAA